MPQASYAFGSFLGGELSAFAQGRFEKPDYRTSLRVCLNSFPVDAGAWTRRPGLKYAGHTRIGNPGRVVKFDFQASAPVTLEFTDGFLRFRQGTALVPANSVAVAAVSTANPAVVQTTSAVTWATGDTLIFPGASTPLLENRQFTATKIDTTHFSLADAITGATIDGAALGILATGTTVAKVHELATFYVSGKWANIRPVQAETTDILLAPNVAPQALTVTTLPTATVNPAFAIASAVFNDGPYLDPFTNGVQATPAAKTGIVTITLSFQAYVATTAYKIGDFVTSAGVNYVSLVDQNVGSAPPSANWTTASVASAINNGQGFLGTDIGRLVRLFSEPPPWAVGTAYVVGNVVSYNPTGVPGAATYWSCKANNTGNIPGIDLTNWTLMPAGAAIWTWGKITSLSNIIDRALAGSASIGDMTSGGGLAAVFDGVFVQAAAASAEKISGAATGLSSYVGKNYSGATDQIIQQTTIYPTSNIGFFFVSAGAQGTLNSSVTFNLRGKASLPASGSDGTLLGTSGAIGNSFSAVTIVSTDQTTAWKYVWIEMIVTVSSGATSIVSAVAELSFFNPPGTGVGSGINVQLLGPPLLYTNPIQTWRLGVYSGTTGYPTCGVYHDGRLYLGGAVGNRFDACYANGMVGGTINFAPTDQYGAVTAAHAIAYTFNSDGVNQILWMDGDLQGVKMGTQAGEWLVKAPTAGPISPLNVSASNVTKHGSTNIQPCRTEHTTVFVQRFARKLLEYFPDIMSGKFSAPNLADKAQHIVRAGIAELAYTSAVTPIIWGRDKLGALFGITYKRDSLASAQPPTYYGWHRHRLGSGRTVESLCAGPSTGGDLDALTMVTNDAASNVRHVEVLTDAQDELTPLTSAWFLDDAVNPTSITSTNSGGAYGFGQLVLNGLWHLNGKTVQVFAGGLDCGDRGDNTTTFTDFVVANGSLTIPYGDSLSVGPGKGLLTAAFVATLSLSQIVVGFTYNSDGQPVRPMSPADSGARNGPAFAKLSRGHRFGMKVSNTLGLSVGGDLTKRMYPAKFLQANGNPIAALTSYSGIIQDSLNDDYDYENGSPCWRVSRPWPATVVIVGSNLSTQDQ